MSIITGDIGKDGAIITVLVGVSNLYRKQLTRKGRTAPVPVPVRAQIDPGSFATAFMPSVFANLGIKPIGKIAIRTPVNDSRRAVLMRSVRRRRDLRIGYGTASLPVR